MKIKKRDMFEWRIEREMSDFHLIGLITKRKVNMNRTFVCVTFELLTYSLLIRIDFSLHLMTRHLEKEKKQFPLE